MIKKPEIIDVPVRVVSKVEALPDMCFAFLFTNNPGKQVVAIKRGESGCYTTAYDEPDPEKAKALVMRINSGLRVTEKQAECMLVGSMFGWDVPGANPAL